MPQWFRFYSEATNDRKIDRICRSLQQSKALIIGAWAILMSIGSESPIRGVLLLTEDIPFKDDDLADELGLDMESTKAILAQFERFQMIHRDNGVIYLTNWDKRQFASDDSAERVRRYRERQKAEESQSGNALCNDDVTLQDRDGNAPEQSRAESEPEQRREAADAAPPPANLTPHQAMFQALAEAYRINLDTITEKQRGRLNADSKRARDAAITLAQVRAASDHWWNEDWRGKNKRSPPTTSQFFTTIEVVTKAMQEDRVQELETW